MIIVDIDQATSQLIEKSVNADTGKTYSNLPYSTQARIRFYTDDGTRVEVPGTFYRGKLTFGPNGAPSAKAERRGISSADLSSWANATVLSKPAGK